jgi:hypothetical protein
VRQQEETQMTIRDIIKRDIGVKVEGVVKVFEHATLPTEFREYVVTDKIEDEVKKICDTFTQVLASTVLMSFANTCPIRPAARLYGCGLVNLNTPHTSRPSLSRSAADSRSPIRTRSAKFS